MLEVGWSEMLVIAVVLIVVVGPKDLPGMLRTFGRTTSKLRSMAGDFQRQFNEALKEAELDDVKKTVDELRSLNPKDQIRKHINPFEKAAADVRAGLDSLKPQPPKQAEPTAHAAGPLKPGRTENPDLPTASAAVEAPVVTPARPASVSKAKPVAKAAKPVAKPAVMTKVASKPEAAPRKTAKSAKART